MRRALLIALILAGSAVATRTKAAEPRKVALLVGVDKYLKPGFKPLQFAEADVLAVGKELEKLDFEVTTLLGSGEGAKKATKANIEAAAEKMVLPLGQPDIAVVMLSGHGQTLKRQPNAQSLGEAYYCPVDAVINRPETQFSLSHLLDNILAPNVGRKMVLVDACRDAPPDVTKGARNPKGIEGRIVSLPEDTAVFFSCRAGQLSFERHELGHGLFSYCVVEGLRGAAANRGEISWATVVAHVGQRMTDPDLTKYMPDSLPQVPIPAGAMPYTVLGRVAIPADALQSTLPAVSATLPKMTEQDERLQQELDEIQDALYAGSNHVSDYFASLASRRLSEWKIEADEGSPIAKYFVAGCQYYGVELEKDQTAAFTLFRDAGQGGVGLAWNNLGAAYETGRGIERNFSEAADSYRLGAESNCGIAAHNLSLLYSRGDGVPKSPEQTFKWDLQAAELGFPLSMYLTARRLRDGLGVEQDTQSAIEWFERAIAAGNTDAMNSLGVMYSDGIGVSQDARKAARYFRMAADRGNLSGMFNYGTKCAVGEGVRKSTGDAIFWYRKGLESLHNESDPERRKDLELGFLHNLRVLGASP
ncbi:MAG: SEL1-like repeat protein [Planctomycetaceae bacterium]|nr:SEL1-like repeat protein [Planctomycetaceae bacterium]